MNNEHETTIGLRLFTETVHWDRDTETLNRVWQRRHGQRQCVQRHWISVFCVHPDRKDTETLTRDTTYFSFFLSLFLLIFHNYIFYYYIFHLKFFEWKKMRINWIFIICSSLSPNRIQEHKILCLCPSVSCPVLFSVSCPVLFSETNAALVNKKKKKEEIHVICV